MWRDRVADERERVADERESLNPHAPHADAIELAVQAVTRVREESELRYLWEARGDRSQWLAELDDLLSRLGRSSAGSPPSVSP